MFVNKQRYPPDICPAHSETKVRHKVSFSTSAVDQHATPPCTTSTSLPFPFFNPSLLPPPPPLPPVFPSVPCVPQPSPACTSIRHPKGQGFQAVISHDLKPGPVPYSELHHIAPARAACDPHTRTHTQRTCHMHTVKTLSAWVAMHL